MKTPITLLIIALAAAACSPISEEGKEAMAQPINCPTAEQDIAVLESERASVLDRLASGAQFVVPVAVAVNILQTGAGSGDVVDDKNAVAGGDYNEQIDAKIKEIKDNCGL